MTDLFITGTDTDSGKTIVTGLLYKAFLRQNISCITHKWCQCGNLEQTDIETHDIIANKKTDTTLKEFRLPYQFQEPVSPHIANTSNDISILLLDQAASTLKKKYERLLIEGAGGLMVPLSRKLTILDILKNKKIPTLLVVDNKVGCINHSLLSLNALKEAGVPIVGFVMTMTKEATHPLAKNDNAKIIEELSQAKCLGEIPYTPSILDNSDSLNSILDKICIELLKQDTQYELV